LRLNAVILASFALSPTLLCAQGKTYTIDYKTQAKDGSEKIRGPRTVVVRNLNTLRYGYKLGGAETIQKPPAVDLSALGTSSAANQTSPKAATPVTPVTPKKVGPAMSAADYKLYMNTLGVQQGVAPTAQPKDPNAGQAAVQAFSDNVHTFDSKIKSLHDRVDDDLKALSAETLAVNADVDDANAATAQVKLATMDLGSMLQESDQNLGVSRAAYVKGLQQHLDPASMFMKGVSSSWKLDPTELSIQQKKIQQLSSEISLLQADLNRTSSNLTALEATAPDSGGVGTNILPALANAQQQLKTYKDSIVNWQSDLKTCETDLDKLLTTLGTIAPDSTAGLAYNKAKEQLTAWQTRVQLFVASVDTDKGWTDDPLSVHYKVSCEFAFAGTQDTVVSLTRTSDALDSFPTESSATGSGSAGSAKGTQPAVKNSPATPVPEKLVTVECTTPIVIAAGVVFSTIPAREFGIQPISTTTNANGTTTPVNIFVATADSSFHPLPAAAVHVRLMEKKNISLLGTIAIAANIKGQNSGGSNAEYLLGPTLGVARYAFLTFGLYIGQETKLGGNFKVGDTVPSNITTAPIQQSYRPGFGMAITFGK
jgi:hypothetical protein